MYTNENPNEDTFEDIHTKIYQERRQQETQKRKHARQKQVRILLSAAVFTLTLSVAAGWQVLGKHSLSDFSAKAPTLPKDASHKTAGTGHTTGTQKKSSTDTAAKSGQTKDTSTQTDQSDPNDSTGSKTDTGNTDTITKTEKDLALSEQRTDPSADTEHKDSHIVSVSEDWNLVLVNPWNPLPEDFEITPMPLENGQSIDARCYSELQDMLADCRAEGLQPLICSSYRTQEKQEALFQERIDELIAEGYSAKDARKKAATSVAIPGTSEHQLGLALDIVDRNQQMLNSAQENTLVQQWLMENSWKYGFILRYPNDKSSLTGIIYEPWHYRYVGKKAAKEIHTRGICLEEYLADHIQ